MGSGLWDLGEFRNIGIHAGTPGPKGISGSSGACGFSNWKTMYG